jgi:hypothetical protein
LKRSAGVESRGVIDLVTYDPKSDEYALIMTEQREWDGSADRVLQLQDKINTYLSFALDGQMARHYPESVGKRIRLQLDCVSEPDADVARFIDLVREKLEPDGIRFVVNLI